MKKKIFFEEIERREKIVDRDRFMKCFSYKLTALLNILFGQNTQDLRKILNEIKQQKIKLNEAERNSTNNKNENDKLNNILITINRIDNCLE